MTPDVCAFPEVQTIYCITFYVVLYTNFKDKCMDQSIKGLAIAIYVGLLYNSKLALCTIVHTQHACNAGLSPIKQ